MAQKKRFGDRRDGTLIRDIDGMHFVMPVIFPGRCDNEAFISERIDLTKTAEYLEKKNACDPDYKYNLFQVIIAAILKTVTLRPKMNRFIANENMYQRNYLSAAFVVKKQFADNGKEGLAFVYAQPEDNIDTIHEAVKKQVMVAKKENNGSSTEDAMDIFGKIPRLISKTAIHIIRWLDRHGWVPKPLIAEDPYYSTVLLSNLGSIKLHSGYHHLTNWGTNSLFLTVGERKKRPFYNDDGIAEMRDSVDLGIIIDERLADGYYYSRSIKLFRKLLEEPELLERPLNEEVEF